MSSTVTDEDRSLVAATRAEAATEAATEAGETVARVRDLDAAGVPCRLYVPDPTAGPAGLLLYLHGGGFVYGDLDTHDAHCRRLANRAGWAVLAAHYRRAPEHPFPAAADDAEEVGAWAVEHRAEIVADRPLVVAGDSAGANLALLVALRHPDALAGQVLVYPFLDPSMASYGVVHDHEDLSLEDCRWFWRLYLQGEGAASDLRADPLRAPSYAGLPPAFVQLAELDVLVPTGRLLAHRLAADGVPTDLAVYPGVRHGFWRHDDNDQYEPAMADLVDFLARLPGSVGA